MAKVANSADADASADAATNGGGGGEQHWCLHDDCLAAVKPYPSANALAAHTAEAHRHVHDDDGLVAAPPANRALRGPRFLVLDIDQTLIDDLSLYNDDGTLATLPRDPDGKVDPLWSSKG